MVDSVKKWLEANHKGDGPIENIDVMAASRVKYTLPGKSYLFQKQSFQKENIDFFANS